MLGMAASKFRVTDSRLLSRAAAGAAIQKANAAQVAAMMRNFIGSSFGQLEPGLVSGLEKSTKNAKKQCTTECGEALSSGSTGWPPLGRDGAALTGERE